MQRKPIDGPPRIAEEHFHGPIGEWALSAGEEFEGSPEALLFSALVMFGAATGRSPYLSIGADHHRANEFLAVLGATGTGKGQTFSMSRRLFQLLDPIWAKNGLRSGLSSGEGLIGLVADPLPDAPNCQPQQKEVVVYESEASRMFRVMKRESNTLSPILRDAWDGRDELATLTVNPLRATLPHISIIVHSTSEEMHSTMPPESLVNGFLNRFLLAENQLLRELPFGGQDTIIYPSKLVSIIRKNLELARPLGEICLSQPARSLWESRYPDLIALESGRIGDYKARGRAHARRLAMLFCLAEGLSEVSSDHLEAALAAWDYSLAVARRLLGNTINPKLEPKEKILSALKSGPKTTTDLHRVFGNNMSADQLNLWLEELLRLGRIDCDSGSTNKGQRRYVLKVTNYELNEFNEFPCAS